MLKLAVLQRRLRHSMGLDSDQLKSDGETSPPSKVAPIGTWGQTNLAIILMLPNMVVNCCTEGLHEYIYQACLRDSLESYRA